MSARDRVLVARRASLATFRLQRLFALAGVIGLSLAACATPEYAVRPNPVPEETVSIRSLEQEISAQQARDLEQHGVQRARLGERLFGFDLQRTLDRLSRVTERPSLNYHMLVVPDTDPNAASLADGRTYITMGMLRYLASRGSREDELAVVLSHELGHTCAQHLVKRYYQMQKEQLMLALVGIGASLATSRGGAGSQMGGLARDVASLVANVAASGYSQEQELEADQLGVRYMIRAGYDPNAALALLEDFKRFDQPGMPFLRTHPYTERRVEDLRRYLLETGGAASIMPLAPVQMIQPPIRTSSVAASQARREEQRKRLLEAQKLYSPGSRSWQNIQKQLDSLR